MTFTISGTLCQLCWEKKEQSKKNFFSLCCFFFGKVTFQISASVASTTCPSLVQMTVDKMKKKPVQKEFLSKFLSLILQSLSKQVGEKVHALLMFSNSTNLHSSERSRRKFLSNLCSSEKKQKCEENAKKKILILNSCCHPSSTCIISVGVCCCVGSRTIGA